MIGLDTASSRSRVAGSNQSKKILQIIPTEVALGIRQARLGLAGAQGGIIGRSYRRLVIVRPVIEVIVCHNGLCQCMFHSRPLSPIRPSSLQAIKSKRQKSPGTSMPPSFAFWPVTEMQNAFD